MVWTSSAEWGRPVTLQIYKASLRGLYANFLGSNNSQKTRKNEPTNAVTESFVAWQTLTFLNCFYCSFDISLWLSLCLSVSVWFCVSLSLFVCLCICLSLYVFVCLSSSLSLRLSVSLWFFLFRYVSLYLSKYMYLCLCLPIALVCQSVSFCFSTYIPFVCLSVCHMPVSLSASLLIWMIWSRCTIVWFQALVVISCNRSCGSCQLRYFE